MQEAWDVALDFKNTSADAQTEGGGQFLSNPRFSGASSNEIDYACIITDHCVSRDVTTHLVRAPWEMLGVAIQ